MKHSEGFLKVVNDAKSRIKEATVAETRERLAANRSGLLIDVREDHEWNAAHAAGAIHLGKGSREQAESAFRRAVQANPRAASAHLSLAGFLWATGRRADAEAELKTAHSLAPDDVVTNRGLVAFYLATGRGEVTGRSSLPTGV